MKDRYRSNLYTLDAERTLIVTEFYKNNESMPPVYRRPHTLLEVCSKMTIRVEDDELLVANLAKNYMGTTAWPETEGIGWLFFELDTGMFYTRKAQDEPMILTDDEKEQFLSVREYWDKNNLAKGMGYLYPDHVEDLQASGVCGADKPPLILLDGHLSPNYNRVLNKGFGAVRKEAQEKLDALRGKVGAQDAESYYFYKSITVVCDAWTTLAKRYAEKASERALEPGITSERKAELLKMAEGLDWISVNPARTFWEANQAYVLYQLFLYLDGNNYAISTGRYDQNVWPFLEKDLADGIITNQQAQEIVDCWFLKIGQMYNARSVFVAYVTGAYSTFQHVTLGGCDQAGKDATNPVTYMALHSPARLLLHDPPVSLRVSKQTPDDLFECAIAASSKAGGIPCFQNDDVIIPALYEGGYYSLEDARNFCVVGCQEYGGNGNDYCASMNIAPMSDANLANALWPTLNNGINPQNGQIAAGQHGYLYDYKSFDELKAAFKEDFVFYVEWMCTMHNLYEYYQMQVLPQPALSAMLDGCVETGVDCSKGGARYNSYGMPLTGVANLIDSMIALKYFVFDEKIVSGKEFLDAILANWEGYDDLHQQVKNMPHRYGNNDPYADEVAKWCMETISEIVTSQQQTRGPLRLGIFTASAHVEAGTHSWATPDGRVAGESLSDCASPMQGADKEGPTAVLCSATSYSHKPFTNGFALNLKFSPSTLAGEDGVKKVKSLMSSYFERGGMEIQYNIVSSDTLRSAQTDPETYKNLVVRVAGFSAYFVELHPTLQDDIIARTENLV
jgi:formate C-acetyltransferase